MESMLTPIKQAKSKSLTLYKKVDIFKHKIIESMTRCNQEIISYSNHISN